MEKRRTKQKTNSRKSRTGSKGQSRVISDKDDKQKLIQLKGKTQIIHASIVYTDIFANERVMSFIKFSSPYIISHIQESIDLKNRLIKFYASLYKYNDVNGFSVLLSYKQNSNEKS